MNIQRSTKSLALKATSKLGTSSRISHVIMKGTQIDFNPPGGIPLGCISVDFVSDSDHFEANRQGTLALLEVAEGHDIPMTWAICGGAAERDMKSFNAILNSAHEHEIAAYPYSPLDAASSTEADFRADIQRSVTAIGLESPRSFVFPGNKEGHFGVLREFGFKAFRGGRKAIGSPILREGLWNIRPVYHLDAESSGAEELILEYLDLCVKGGGVFHIWTRPWEFVQGGDSGAVARTFNTVLGRMEELKQESKLLTSTMGGISYIMESTSGQTVPLAVP